MEIGTTELQPTATKTLPAALFDEIKKRADAAGGIGYGPGNSWNGQFPRCIGDFAAQIDDRQSLKDTFVSDYFTLGRTPSVQALLDALGENYGNRNDDAIGRVNGRKGITGFEVESTRVSFDELVAELGLVRGEA